MMFPDLPPATGSSMPSGCDNLLVVFGIDQLDVRTVPVSLEEAD